MNSRRFDVIVIGAGVAGLMTALEFLQQGLKVLVVEKGIAGRESSWAGGGILSPLYAWRAPSAVYRLALLGHQLYPQLCDQLTQQTGVDSQYQARGLLVLNQTLDNQIQEYVGQTQLAVVELDAGEACASLVTANRYLPALLFPEVAAVRPPRLLKALVAQLGALGGDLLEGAEVHRIGSGDSRVRGVHVNDNFYAANGVVVCAGAWSDQLCAQYLCPTEIHPVKGQMILVTLDTCPLSQILLADGRYIIPRGAGDYVIGSTVEHVAFDKSISSDVADALRDFASALCPDFAAAKITKQWAGLRPSSPDGIPYIASHPQVEGLFINAGHYRNGVVMAPAAAKLVVDLVLQRTPILDPTPYRWQRD